MNKTDPYTGIAGIYEEIRPSYPEELIQDIIVKTKLEPNAKLLEIGAGTGKATMLFARKGYTIQAIEIGKDMADILKDKCNNIPNVTVDVEPFENWIPRNNEKFDMIFSAQSFHWIDPHMKFQKCYDLLKDHSYLVVFWYTPIPTISDQALPLEKEIQRIISKYTNQKVKGKQSNRRSHDAKTVDERQIEILSSKLFRLEEKIEYRHGIQSSAKQYIKAMKSIPEYANHLDALDKKSIESMDQELEDLINRYGGYVESTLIYSLYLCRKF